MAAASANSTEKVWDPLVRISHWLLAASIVLAWYTRHRFGVWHEYLGYIALVIVVIRICWGFAGPRYARFNHFVRPPGYTFNYTRSVISGTQTRYIGHNPLAGWMAVSLLTMTIMVCASGWLYTTDRFWGVEWVEELHNIMTYILLALVVLHICGAVFTSLHHRENLITAMIHGKKRAPGENDII